MEMEEGAKKERKKRVYRPPLENAWASAYVQNFIFDSMRQGMSDSEIARKLQLLKLGKTHSFFDHRKRALLKVLKPETAKALLDKQLRRSDFDRAHRINHIYKLLGEKLSISEIARRVGKSRVQVYSDMDVLRKGMRYGTFVRMMRKRKGGK